MVDAPRERVSYSLVDPRVSCRAGLGLNQAPSSGLRIHSKIDANCQAAALRLYFPSKTRHGFDQNQDERRVMRVFFLRNSSMRCSRERNFEVYKRILVAVDGSETANTALQEAIKLAKDHDAQIRLFHVVALTMAYSVAEAPHIFEYRKAMEDAGRTLLAGCSTWPRSACVQFDAKCAVMFAKHVYEVIEEEATEWPADLVVTGHTDAKVSAGCCSVASRRALRGYQASRYCLFAAHRRYELRLVRNFGARYWIPE
jgi:nucleotide-binding universal stress UspA family protein